MALLFPIFNLGSVVLVLLKFLLACVMIILAFNFKSIKDFFKLFFVFVTFTGMMGGICFMISFALKPATEFMGGNLIYDGMPMGAILLIIFIFSKLVIDFIKFFENKQKLAKFKYKTTIITSNKSFEFTGFMDSGNLLVDPLTLKPVIIIGIGAFKEIFNLKSQDIISGNYKINNSRWIDITSATKSSKMLVFEVDEVEIYFQEKMQIKNAILGVALKNFKQQFNSDLLLNFGFIK